MNFSSLIFSIEKTHQHFQQQAVSAVNISLTLRNWLIGFYIIEFEQKGDDRAKYGTNLLQNISKKLAIKGLVGAELSRCRQFYNAYPQILGTLSQDFQQFLPESILGTLSQKSLADTPDKNENNALPAKTIFTKLSYSHLIELIKIDDLLKRNFYEIESIKGTWSVRELKRQINSLYFERSGLSTNPQKLSQMVLHNAEKQNASGMIKSVYAFEFLGLVAKEVVEERDLENALLNHLQEFMLELGNGFCLEARQKKILIGDEYFFIDLVFYHRILKCHVLVELKMEEFSHQNIGQLNTYLNYYKAEISQKDDNLPIGILLVTNKNQALVEYATASLDNHLFVSKYLLELPKKEQLENFINNELKIWK